MSSINDHKILTRSGDFTIFKDSGYYYVRQAVSEVNKYDTLDKFYQNFESINKQLIVRSIERNSILHHDGVIYKFIIGRDGLLVNKISPRLHRFKNREDVHDFFRSRVKDRQLIEDAIEGKGIAYEWGLSEINCSPQLWSQIKSSAA